jgi:hypothetical protein
MSIPVQSAITAPRINLGADAGPFVSAGTGSPEGVVTAPVGSLYARSDGGTGTVIYRKESGAGNTGWTASAPVIENRTSDPGSPVTGQIWLRTDL